MFQIFSEMPVYDCSLRDFLEYISSQRIRNNEEICFPLIERIEMTKRILDDLLFINEKMGQAHGDIKLRSVSKYLSSQTQKYISK